MAIVADIKRKPEFEAKMRFHAFDDLDIYEEVVEVYILEVEGHYNDK